MRALRLLPILLAAALVAGCAAPTSPGTGGPQDAGTPAEQQQIYDALERAIGEPLTPDGPDPTLPSAYNLVRLATLNGPPERTPGVAEGYIETAVKGGYAYLCRSGTDEGLVIFDVRDIENPSYVSSIRLDAGFEADIEVNDAGTWAFWETQRIPGTGIPDATNPTSVPGALPYGIHIVDISDKANPTWAGFTPVPPNGPHSITYATASAVRTTSSPASTRGSTSAPPSARRPSPRPGCSGSSSTGSTPAARSPSSSRSRPTSTPTPCTPTP